MGMAEEHRMKMLEALADYDDELLRRYLDSHELPVDLVKGAIRKGTLAGRITPVLCGSAYRNRGVRRLLDAVVDYLPSPAGHAAGGRREPGHPRERKSRSPSEEEPFAAVAFKIMTDPYVGKLTYFRVYSGRVETGTSGPEREPRRARADRAHVRDAREPAGGDRRHRRGRASAPWSG